MRSINAGVCHINTNKHQIHSFISFMRTVSMSGNMLGTGEKERHGPSYDRVNILVEEKDNKEGKSQCTK